MKTDKICEKYLKENISINTWIEDDIFFIKGDSKTLMFLADLIKAQAKETRNDNICIGKSVAGSKFFSKKAKFGILIQNTDSKI
ncbi:hypothetical protein [Campylobacter sputorum]|uniref:hypothetical protein n=1 Tax=Campylobacter sputorum TaxID=206 RepID=UPI000B786AEB|nr:hypothetical protein [Campylobacter sputorum]ASM36865.1 hypothetical protein CSF_0996 [Campylobacter sputorum bv. faecalis CCUG 20703]ASM38552.1 hypothetical protein CSPARA_0988 [Campylobacter sputorum bv. paraureolyticus LMG 11764]